MSARVALKHFFVDFLLLMVATLLAFVLRENMEPTASRLVETLPYFIATAISAAVAIPLLGLNRTIWRMTSMPDYLRVMATTIVVVIGAVGLTFTYNRLDGVARSLPVLQAMVAICLLVGTRVAFRLRHSRRQARRIDNRPLQVVGEGEPSQVILLVGLSRLTETFLQSIDELAPGTVRVAGVLGKNDRQVGRLVASHRVLGLPEDVARVIADLEVQGVVLDRIVVTCAFPSLSQNAREALLDIERSGSIGIQFLAEDLGLVTSSAGSKHSNEAEDDASPEQLRFSFDPSELQRLGARPYWRVKRMGDVLLSGIMVVALAPLFAVVAVLVATSIGFPVMFWQQRPGLGGRPFRAYKFRTMAAAHDAYGRRIPDADRVSRFGTLLRRTRLDELPQLLNILRGEMSLVGPRPLLPRDQADAHRARLLVRPGLTGWAQVVGGRVISPEDKAALDVWYIKHASLWLDVNIVLRTVRMVVAGEVVSWSLVRVAWRDLHRAGVLRQFDEALPRWALASDRSEVSNGAIIGKD